MQQVLGCAESPALPRDVASEMVLLPTEMPQPTHFSPRQTKCSVSKPEMMNKDNGDVYLNPAKLSPTEVRIITQFHLYSIWGLRKNSHNLIE